MSPATKKREKLYHSHVSSEPEGMAMKLSSDVKEGNYGPYCFVRVYGEDEDRLFSLDSTKARREYERVREMVGEDAWVVCEAAGRDESATLFFKDSDGNPILDGEPTQPSDAPFPPNNAQPNQPAQPAQPAQPSEADTAALRERQEPEAPQMGSGNAKTFLHALEAAHEAMEAFRNKHGFTPSEEVRRVATTIFINLT